MLRLLVLFVLSRHSCFLVYLKFFFLRSYNKRKRILRIIFLIKKISLYKKKKWRFYIQYYLQILTKFWLSKGIEHLSLKIPRFIASIITALYNVCTNEYPISRNLFAVKVACVYRPLSRNVRDIRVEGWTLPLDDQTTATDAP